MSDVSNSCQLGTRQHPRFRLGNECNNSSHNNLYEKINLYKKWILFLLLCPTDPFNPSRLALPFLARSKTFTNLASLRGKRRVSTDDGLFDP